MHIKAITFLVATEIVIGMTTGLCNKFDGFNLLTWTCCSCTNIVLLAAITLHTSWNNSSFVCISNGQYTSSIMK